MANTVRGIFATRPQPECCIFLLYFAWADQRVQQFYNYQQSITTILFEVIELWLGSYRTTILFEVGSYSTVVG